MDMDQEYGVDAREDSLDAKFGHAEIDINEHGGRQSKLEYRFDLISPSAQKQLAHVLWYGVQRYGKNNWHKITVDEHLNHALFHINAYLADASEEDHLGHAYCRLMMALDRDIAETAGDTE